jgi:hypothetical protein
MLRYKLTTQNLQTHNGFQWEIGKTVTTDGSGSLCSQGWLHCYTHPLLAVLLNPIHADIDNPKLFEVGCSGITKTDNGLKEGFTEMTIMKQLDLPVITTTQKIAFAILCSLEVYKAPAYVEWADNWLSGKDRAASAASRAARAAARAADAAASAVWAAASAASRAASAAARAARAAEAAASAASAARAAYAALAAASAASRAARAADAAAEAADAAWAARAAASTTSINLIAIAEKAITY